jgi:WD repeat-containing protein 35
VLAAFEVDSFKQRVFDAQVAQITGTGATAADIATKTMNSLITSDISSSADKALTNPWKGAEAIHFYLLCQRQLYQKDYNRAMKTAMRLIEYEKELQTKDVYSLVAIASFFNGCFRECSRALVKLERLDTINKAEREAYELLAINLFSRHPPVDKSKVEN